MKKNATLVVYGHVPVLRCRRKITYLSRPIDKKVSSLSKQPPSRSDSDVLQSSMKPLKLQRDGNRLRTTEIYLFYSHNTIAKMQRVIEHAWQ